MERRILTRLSASPDAELVVVYGRRRVGKTHLVRHHFQSADLYFEVTGQHDGPMAVQLGHFQREVERVFFANARIPTLSTWEEAFELLASQLEAKAQRTPKANFVVFLDELPWLSTRRSRLIPALDHSWNTRLSRLRSLTLVLCGSAASFMLDKLIHAKGGLHNRVTQRLRLEPFTLGETRDYLRLRGVRSSHSQVLELYLALGGIPHYLRGVTKGGSAAQNIGEICFGKNALLRGEFDVLFSSLFENADVHEAIARALHERPEGMTRTELAAATGASSGGRFARRLRELEEAGFVAGRTPYGRRTKDTTFRLTDAFVAFHLRWIERATGNKRAPGAYWVAKSKSPAFRAWSGFAFERICFRHTLQIRRALGIDEIATEVGSWRHIEKRGTTRRGAQIDLLFDRDDGVITLCEIKHTDKPFKIDKTYAVTLRNKVTRFIEQTKTNKDVQLALISTHGLTPNIWSEDLIDATVDLQALFDDP